MLKALKSLQKPLTGCISKIQNIVQKYEVLTENLRTQFI